MPSSWHRRGAASAQAVVARSYALATDRGGALRPLRRHPQPGLRRAAPRRPRRPTGRSRRPPSKVVKHRGEVVDHLLLLDLRRADRERRVRVLGRQPGPVPEVGQGPATTASRPVHTLEGDLLGSRRWSRGSAACSTAAAGRSRSLKTGRLAADRPAPGGRLRTAAPRSPAPRSARASACARPGPGSATAQLSRRGRAAPGSRGRSRASRSRRRRPPLTRASAARLPSRSTVSSRSEIEQLSVLCSGPTGSA